MPSHTGPGVTVPHDTAPHLAIAAMSNRAVPCHTSPSPTVPKIEPRSLGAYLWRRMEILRENRGQRLECIPKTSIVGVNEMIGQGLMELTHLQ